MFEGLPTFVAVQHAGLQAESVVQLVQFPEPSFDGTFFLNAARESRLRRRQRRRQEYTLVAHLLILNDVTRTIEASSLR